MIIINCKLYIKLQNTEILNNILEVDGNIELYILDQGRNINKKKIVKIYGQCKLIQNFLIMKKY